MSTQQPWIPPAPRGPPQQQPPPAMHTSAMFATTNLTYDNYEPRDPSSSATASDVRHPPPLKRGDACLYCRRRRIRCSATKPQCHHCAKLKRECVYDVGKPVSRVRKLENKVAELEGYLRQANVNVATSDTQSASPGSSGGPPTVPHQTPQPMHHMLGQMPPGPAQINIASPTSYAYASGAIDQSTVDITMLDNFQPAPGMRDMAGRLGVTVPSPPAPGHGMRQPQPGYDWDTLDPSYMSLVANFSETGMPAPEAPPSGWHRARQSNQPHPHPHTQVPLPHQQPPPPPPQQRVPPPAPQPAPPPTQSQYQQPQDQPDDGSSSHFIAYVPQGVALGAPIPLPSNMNHVGQINVAYATSPPEDSTLVGGWYDPNDLPKAARDELLGHFFGGMRMLSRGFNIPRFMASLAMPLTKRPHPCLLYSMYTFVSRFSPSAKLRKLEDHFAEIATTQLRESVQNVDRVFDAIRASNIMAVYYYSKAQYHVGTMMTAQAARLAICCGLHQITSSVFKATPRRADAASNRLLGMMRRRGWLIPPAQDAVEHGERIWAFWNVYLLDRTGSIATQWPPNIHDDDVCTPFPKPLYEYELGLVSKKDDYSLSSMYEEGPPQILPYNTDGSANILYMKAFSILDRVSKLLYLPAERQRSSSWSSNSSSSLSPVDIDEYLRQQTHIATNPASGGEPRTNNRTPRLRTPRSYEKYRAALHRLENELPPDRRTAWGVWDGHIGEWIYKSSDQNAITLYIILGCSWMLLFDTCSYQAENVEAVACARRIASTIRTLLPNHLKYDFEAFVAMIFSLVSMVLIREVKRLQALGDHVTAASIHEDFDIVLTAMKKDSESQKIGRDQATRAEDVRNAPLEDSEFLASTQGEDVECVHDEPGRPLPPAPPPPPAFS